MAQIRTAASPAAGKPTENTPQGDCLIPEFWHHFPALAQKLPSSLRFDATSPSSLRFDATSPSSLRFDATSPQYRMAGQVGVAGRVGESRPIFVPHVPLVAIIGFVSIREIRG
jgi:hypothetical protein